MWLIATANAIVVVDFLKPLFVVWFDFNPKTDPIRTAYTPTEWALSIHHRQSATTEQPCIATYCILFAQRLINFNVSC